MKEKKRNTYRFGSLIHFFLHIAAATSSLLLLLVVLLLLDYLFLLLRVQGCLKVALCVAEGGGEQHLSVLADIVSGF